MIHALYKPIGYKNFFIYNESLVNNTSNTDFGVHVKEYCLNLEDKLSDE